MQFIAKRILEEYCRKHPADPIEISMLAVDRIRYQHPSWDCVQQVIRLAMLQNNGPRFTATSTTVIMQLKHMIMQFKTEGLPAEVKKTVDTFRFVIKGEGGTRFYTVGSHAEALLGSLIKFSDTLATGDPALDEFCKVHIFISSWPKYLTND